VFRRLLDDLQATKAVDLWFDEARIPFGGNFASAIEGAMGRSDVCLVVLSHRMDASPWLQQEARLAHEIQRGRNTLAVIGVAIDKAFPREHLRAVPFQIIDLSRDYDHGFDTLLEVLAPRPRDAAATFDVLAPVSGSSIVQVSDIIGRKLIEHFHRNPDALRRIDRRKFEELVAELFGGFGYQVELTRRTRDGGRDVVAVKHTEVAVKYLIECKRPDPGGYVGVRPVRELYGVKQDEAATKAILATTAYFSPDALLFFDRHRWELEPRDYFGVTEWIVDYVRGDAGPKLRGT
jgi:HJR/Mrr/RecB family endonuclease